MSKFKLKYSGEKINELLDKAGTAVQSLEGYATEEWVNEQGFVTEVPDVSNFATTSQLAEKQDTIEDLDTIRQNASIGARVIGEDGYVYSNGEKVDMRFTRSLLPVGTSIPAKANLNTIQYLKIGKYYCSLNVDAKTVTNCPVSVAFSMEVFNPLGTNVDDEETKEYTYRLRVLTQYDTGQQYVQFCRTSGTPGKWTYDSWYVTPRVKFTLNSSKNDGSAAIGATNRGVYVDSTGEIKVMSYTIAKSVPSNAVFTDTNTKVTSVDNHYEPIEDEEAVINATEGEFIVGIKRDAKGHIVGVISAPQSSSEIPNLDELLSTKQDTISDLDEIRNGASKGATALQSIPEEYATKTYVDNLISNSITNTLNTPV